MIPHNKICINIRFIFYFYCFDAAKVYIFSLLPNNTLLFYLKKHHFIRQKDSIKQIYHCIKAIFHKQKERYELLVHTSLSVLSFLINRLLLLTTVFFIRAIRLLVTSCSTRIFSLTTRICSCYCFYTLNNRCSFSLRSCVICFITGTRHHCKRKCHCNYSQK